MKRTLLLFLVLLLCTSADVYSQSVETPERKYYYLLRAEKSIFNLPVSQDSIENIIYPEILGQRDILSPHYPSISDLPRNHQARDDAFYAWINNHEDEYSAYYSYLAAYIRKLNQ